MWVCILINPNHVKGKKQDIVQKESDKTICRAKFPSHRSWRRFCPARTTHLDAIFCAQATRLASCYGCTAWDCFRSGTTQLQDGPLGFRNLSPVELQPSANTAQGKRPCLERSSHLGSLLGELDPRKDLQWIGVKDFVFIIGVQDLEAIDHRNQIIGRPSRIRTLGAPRARRLRPGKETAR